MIEEWCEGVLCSKDQSHNLLGSDNYSEANSRKPYNLLLEKIAIHLQRDAGGSQAIDIRGLTKVLLYILQIDEDYLVLIKLFAMKSLFIKFSVLSKQKNEKTI